MNLLESTIITQFVVKKTFPSDPFCNFPFTTKYKRIHIVPVYDFEYYDGSRLATAHHLTTNLVGLYLVGLRCKQTQQV